MKKTTWLWIGILAFGVVALGYSARHLGAQCCGGGGAKVVPGGGQASQPATKVVNARCPIMGGAIDSAKVPASLTREYNGQKVGFCCGGCPAQWDKLTTAEKDAKLKKASDAK